MILHLRRLFLSKVEDLSQIKTFSSGFTLVEILVSLAISGIVIAGVLSVFDNSNKSYILQEDIARMQQNVRMAKYYIEKDLRMAGYGVRDFNFMDVEKKKPLQFYNNLQGDSDVLDSTDRVIIRYIDDDEGSCGAPSVGKIACDQLPQLTLNGSMPEKSAEALVNENLQDPYYAVWGDGCSCGGIDYNSPHFGFQIIITSPNGSQSDVVFLTQVQINSDKIQNRPYKYQDEDGNEIKYDNKILNEYPDNSTISFFNSNSFKEISYFIDKEYYLRRDDGSGASKVADNIEDVQMSFCGDYSGDGFVSLAYDPADPDNAGDDWFDEGNLVSGELSDTDREKIRFIRVTILGRTSKQYKGITSKRPGIEDHAAATQSDGYHRRLLSFTVQVRNFGLND